MRITDNQSLIFQERQDHTPGEVGSIDHINLTIRASTIQDVAAYLRENGAEIVRRARPAGNWTFEAAPMQIDGTDIGKLRYRWVVGDGDPQFEPPDLIRGRHWQLKALDFTPTGRSVRLELSFWWEGAERRYAHAWGSESDFQSSNVTIIRS